MLLKNYEKNKYTVHHFVRGGGGDPIQLGL